MPDFYIYDTKTGAIISSGSCTNRSDLLLQSCDEHSIIVEGRADYLTQFVKNGTLVTMNAEQQEVYQQQLWRRTEFDFNLFVYKDERLESEILEENKLKKWNEIKQIRADKEVAPLVYGGNIYDADMKSQQRISGAVQFALLVGDGFAIEWTLADNTQVKLFKQDVIDLGLAVARRTGAIYFQSNLIRDAIKSASTIEAVNSISWDFLTTEVIQ